MMLLLLLLLLCEIQFRLCAKLRAGDNAVSYIIRANAELKRFEQDFE
jgi:hypothetical protein